MWVQKHFSLLFFAVSFYLISNVTSICGSMSLNYPWKVALVLHMHSISYAICTNIVPIFSSQTFCYISKNALVNGIPLFPFTFQWISCLIEYWIGITSSSLFTLSQIYSIQIGVCFLPNFCIREKNLNHRMIYILTGMCVNYYHTIYFLHWLIANCYKFSTYTQAAWGSIKFQFSREEHKIINI